MNIGSLNNLDIVDPCFVLALFGHGILGISAVVYICMITYRLLSTIHVQATQEQYGSSWCL